MLSILQKLVPKKSEEESVSKSLDIHLDNSKSYDSGLTPVQMVLGVYEYIDAKKEGRLKQLAERLVELDPELKRMEAYEKASFIANYVLKDELKNSIGSFLGYQPGEDINNVRAPGIDNILGEVRKNIQDAKNGLTRKRVDNLTEKRNMALIKEFRELGLLNKTNFFHALKYSSSIDFCKSCPCGEGKPYYICCSSLSEAAKKPYEIPQQLKTIEVPAVHHQTPKLNLIKAP